MDFLNASFLWGLPLIAVPVVIHLLNRRRRNVVRWGAMQFLLEAVARRRRRWRLEDLLLMLLRVAAVAAVVIALAQPRIRTHWFGPSGPRDIILVVDDSLSTGLVDTHGTAFEAVCGRAEETIAQLNEADYIRILRASQPIEWLDMQAARATASNKDQLTAQLRELKPTLAAADMMQAVRKAIDAEPADARAPRVITIVTDGRAYGWRADARGSWRDLQRQAQSAGVALHMLTVGDGQSGISNLSLDSLGATRAVAGVNEQLSLTAVVRNTGERASPAGLVRLLRGEEGLSTLALPALEPDQTTSVNFSVTIDAPGTHLLRAEIATPDDLPLDNDASLAVEIVEQVPILLVSEAQATQPLLGDTGYLETVLGWHADQTASTPRCAFQPKVMTVDELTPESVRGFKCIVLADVPELAPPIVEALRDAVRQGTGLWVVLGDRTDPSFFNESLYAEGQGLSPMAVGEVIGDPTNHEKYEMIPPPAANHPATRWLADTQRLDVNRAKVFRRCHLGASHPGQAASASAGTLLATGDGDPLVVEKMFGRGHVIVQGVPMDMSWSNLPLCQVFVVMVHEWLWYLAEPGLTQWNLGPGEALTVALPADRTNEWAEITTPNGTQLKVNSELREGNRVFVFGKTMWPGAYQLSVFDRQGHSRVLPCVVNRDPKESNLTRLSEEDREVLASSGSLESEDRSALAAATSVAVARPQPMWSWLLVIVLGFMLVELLLSGRITRRRFEQTPGVALVPAE